MVTSNTTKIDPEIIEKTHWMSYDLSRRFIVYENLNSNENFAKKLESSDVPFPTFRFF